MCVFVWGGCVMCGQERECVCVGMCGFVYVWPCVSTLYQTKFHHVCITLAHVPVLNQISPIHVCHPVSWRSVSMFSTLMCFCLPNGLSVRVSQTKVRIFHFPMHATYPSYLIVCLIPQTIFCESRDYEPACNIVFFISLLPFPVLGPYIILSTLISDTLSLCSSPLVRDQVSHPYKTTC